MLEKIRCSSLASIQSVRACGFNAGTARTTMRRKCFASRASFRHVPILFKKVLFRHRVVSFDIVRSDACSRTYKLTDDSVCHRSLRNRSRKIDDRLSEPRCPFLKIVNAVLARFLANNWYHIIIPKRFVVIVARALAFGFRHSFVIRHSSFVILVIRFFANDRSVAVTSKRIVIFLRTLAFGFRHSFVIRH